MDELRLFLDSAFEARLEADRMQNRLTELRTRAEKITADITGMPRGGGSDRDRLLALVSDAAQTAEARMTEYEERYNAVQTFIDNVPGKPMWRTVLRLRYLEFLRWTSIVDRLGVSERHVYELHGEALRAAREVFNAKQ